MIVHARPAHPDRADELNEWYDEVHLPELVGLPGFVGARRYVVCDRSTGEPDPADPSYIAVYELEADDLTAPLRAMADRPKDGPGRTSDALQVDPPPVVTFCRLLEG
jgi:hypothetical protein